MDQRCGVVSLQAAAGKNCNDLGEWIKDVVWCLCRLLQARTVRISGSGSNMWCGVFVGCGKNCKDLGEWIKDVVWCLYRLLQARTVNIWGIGSKMWCGVFVGCCRQEL